MSDVCLAVSSYVTLMACVTNPVCSKEPVDGKIFCEHQIGIEALQPVIRPSCNRTIVNYICTRPDGTMYEFSK